jgi:hypothetical protein
LGPNLSTHLGRQRVHSAGSYGGGNLLTYDVLDQSLEEWPVGIAFDVAKALYQLSYTAIGLAQMLNLVDVWK